MLFTVVTMFAQVNVSSFFPNSSQCGQFWGTYTLSGYPAGNTYTVKITITKPAAGGGVGPVYWTTSYTGAVNTTISSGNWGPSCGGDIPAGKWNYSVAVYNGGSLLASSSKSYTVAVGYTCAPCGGGGARTTANASANNETVNGPGNPGDPMAITVSCNSFFPNTSICGSFWGSFTVSNLGGVTLTRKVIISGPNGVYSTQTSTGAFNGSYNSGNWGLACGGNVPSGTWTMYVQLLYANGTIAASCQKSYTIGVGYTCAPCSPGGTRMSSFENEETTTSLSVSPNPATDHLNVQIPTDLGINKLKVINLNGQIVMEKDINSDTNELELNVNSLPNAMYILRLEGTGKPQMTKFIKE